MNLPNTIRCDRCESLVQREDAFVLQLYSVKSDRRVRHRRQVRCMFCLRRLDLCEGCAATFDEWVKPTVDAPTPTTEDGKYVACSACDDAGWTYEPGQTDDTRHPCLKCNMDSFLWRAQ